jgi:mRNA interferase MazF
MSIPFVPNPGTVLMCDFTGFMPPPEMTKIRHVVVVSKRSRRVNINNGTCLVVPFSTQPPTNLESHHVLMQKGKYPFFHADKDVWAKGDLVSHVSFQRLDRVLIDGRHSHAELSPEDFKSIQKAVLHALNLGFLTSGV